MMILFGLKERYLDLCWCVWNKGWLLSCYGVLIVLDWSLAVKNLLRRNSTRKLFFSYPLRGYNFRTSPSSSYLKDTEKYGWLGNLPFAKRFLMLSVGDVLVYISFDDFDSLILRDLEGGLEVCSEKERRVFIWLICGFRILLYL